MSMRVLARVQTIRRIWLAAPFVGIALFGVPTLLSLIYEDAFELSAAERGLVAAGIEPLQIVGVILATPAVSRIATSDPGFLLRFVAAVGIVDGVLLVVLAYAPNLALAIGIHALLAASIGTLAPAFLALVSLIAPPRVRSAAFSTMSLFAIPGVAVVLPILGAISDAFGIQASVLQLVPVSVAAGLVLASAARHVAGDIEAVRAEAAQRAAGAALAPAKEDGTMTQPEPPTARATNLASQDDPQPSANESSQQHAPLLPGR